MKYQHLYDLTTDIMNITSRPDIANPRLSNFCGPNSTAPSTEYGFGCGYGTCAPEGTHCICDPGYVYGVYFQNYPACWETEMTRPAILITLGILALIAVFLALGAASVSLRDMKSAALSNAIGSLSIVGVQLAMQLEGFFGIAAAILMGFCAIFLIRSFAIIGAAMFQPILQIS